MYWIKGPNEHKTNKKGFQLTLFDVTSFCFAEASRNTAFQDSANLWPSSWEITRSICKSFLLPTNTTGTLNNQSYIDNKYKSDHQSLYR